MNDALIDKDAEQIRGGESAKHRELKRLALIWAQAHGYRAAAAEVSLPNQRFRLDVAGYREQRIRERHPVTGRMRQRAAVGVTAVFECKVSRSDFARDARSEVATLERLEILQTRKARIEEELRLHYPSIRNGDSLFQEFESVDFERPGHERYATTLRDIRRLTQRLHANTKFDRLLRWGAANLFWVVAEPGVMALRELPPGWGLLVREGDKLCVVAKPLLQEIEEAVRLSLFQRIALAACRAVNREHGIGFEDFRQGG